MAKETKIIEITEESNPGLPDVIAEIKRLRGEKEEIERKLSENEITMKASLDDIFIEQYNKEGENPGSFYIKSGDIRVLIVPQDAYASVDEKKYDDICKRIGIDIVKRTEMIGVNAKMMLKYEQLIKQFIGKSTEILIEDKKSFFLTSYKYEIIKGTIDSLLKYKLKINEAVKLIRPTIQSRF